MQTFSRYAVFCRVIETGSFTLTAKQIGYSQSAVSQIVKALEREFGSRLISRESGRLSLTRDGAQLYPYFQAVVQAEQALGRKRTEMQGLENSTIRIGSFTSVSRNILAPMMKEFNKSYPRANFVVKLGEYNENLEWILDGSVDFGFTGMAFPPEIETKELFSDEMVAVLPPDHPLAAKESLTLADLAATPLILLYEGEYSILLDAFREKGLTPDIRYTVTDDYTILEMIRGGLGVSALYSDVIKGYGTGFAVRKITDMKRRTVSIAWKNWETMPLAAKHFARHLMDRAGEKERRQGKSTR